MWTQTFEKNGLEMAFSHISKMSKFFMLYKFKVEEKSKNENNFLKFPTFVKSIYYHHTPFPKP